eukprot:TRINITY_DN4129_c0_g1_i3.p2 TRINITY_DN4129_c0_g1~~TRINITY_DN4129_c0_g1_i3.p2  ORF type:complete len:168 (-),score=35.92 TRINITY_DN4129_c0_g1_i3:171-674(-)
MTSPKKTIRKDACRAISYVTSGNKNQIQAVIDTNIVPPLVQLLSNPKFDIKKAALRAVCNALSGGTAEQIRYFVHLGCVRPLCDLLGASDSRVVADALESLKKILELGEDDAKSISTSNIFSTLIDNADGVDKIDALQSHHDSDVCKNATEIIRTYFNTEEEEEEED